MRVVLRIQTSPEKRLSRSGRPNRRLAHLGASLVWPLAIFCLFVCGWRWSYDLAWTGRFLVTDGVLFHWQVWFVAAALLHLLGIKLARYGGSERPPAPPDVIRASEPPQAQIP